MPGCYRDAILKIDRNADVELVGDIADANFGYFSKMTHANWVACVNHAKRMKNANK